MKAIDLLASSFMVMGALALAGAVCALVDAEDLRAIYWAASGTLALRLGGHARSRLRT